MFVQLYKHLLLYYGPMSVFQFMQQLHLYRYICIITIIGWWLSHDTPARTKRLDRVSVAWWLMTMESHRLSCMDSISMVLFRCDVWNFMIHVWNVYHTSHNRDAVQTSLTHHLAWLVRLACRVRSSLFYVFIALTGKLYICIIFRDW